MTAEAADVIAAYDALAGDYDNLYPNWDTAAESSYETLSGLLPALRDDSRILDCACGTGMECLSLARRGHCVQGSDASNGMLGRAVQRFESHGLHIPTTHCTWAELPRHFGSGAFDIVLCWGNSVSHCDSPSALAASLHGMSTVLSAGGTLAIQTRDWDRLLAEKPRFTVGNLLHRGDHHLIPMYIWSLRGMWQQSSVEIVFLELVGDVVQPRSYTLPMWPIPFDHLMHAVADAGLTGIERRGRGDGRWYALLAKKP